MGLFAQFKTLLPVQLLIGYIFVMSGLVVTFLMLCSCIIFPFNKHLYRKINVNLAYMHWSQFTFLGQWWSGMTVHLYINEEDFRLIGKEHNMTIMNHKYDIDWLAAWIIAERFGMLGNTKIYGKQVLKYVPLIGWAWYFTESIFLKREWEHDKRIIQKDLQQACDYPDGYPVTLLLFPEGTRFTEKKHIASLEVCRAKGYPELRHVLLPRPKGFIVSMHGLKGHFKTIINCTVAFERKGLAPTLMNILNGKPLVAHFHAERLMIDDVPLDTDEICAGWLRDLFKKKDDLYEEFLQTGRFPGEIRQVRRRHYDLIWWIVWAVVTCVPLFYYLIGVFVAGTLAQRLISIGLIILATVIVRLMITVTEIEKGSKYGVDADKFNSEKAE
ncbi:hypothetical protein RRG08_035031 [Elysia crispata]|uniref:Phospholipid/glycerol acyltransferase domain-containing protein n=1 Tax=Elysia crispata TaxID=231223 RepID=A0AAE1DLA5_9GAST|nr:hypothetical protein RRG08_035031 [Elysia crispata]